MMSFKNTKVVFRNAAEFNEVQTAMFKLGFRWMASKTGSVRELIHISGITGGIIYIDEDCRMTWGTHEDHCMTDSRKMRTRVVLFLAVAEHQAAKAVERKASRARKAARKLEAPTVTTSFQQMISAIVSDANGWTEHTGGVCPVARDVLIDVRYRDCMEKFSLPALRPSSGRDTQQIFWNNDCMDNDIVAYRLTKSGPVVDADGWIKHEATILADEPTTGDTVLEARLVNGEIRVGTARNLLWNTRPSKDYRIAAYRTFRVLDVSEPEPSAVFDVVAEAAKEEAIDTNPKRQFGLKSVPLNLWSPLASAYGALALYNGSEKYGRGNYKATKVEASIYLAAALRHLAAWAEGEEFDPADGVPNLGGALANIAIIIDSRAAGMLIDDRQIRGGYLQERAALGRIVESLSELHADKHPRHYSIADNK